MLSLNYYYVKALKTVLAILIISAVIVMFSVTGLMFCKGDLKSLTAANNIERSFPLIIIDPGHGGEDGGAEANGVTEKNVNLAISLMMSDYFEVSDYDCVLTRNDDRLLYGQGEEKNKKRHDLLNRIKFANSYDDAVFVSIHQNKFEIPKYKGLQVYYSANNPQSEVLAKIIQSNSKEYIDSANNREVKQADFRIKVLDMLKIPAVLIECGFLSNPDEAYLLSTTEYQKKIALVAYLSLVEYINN